jgi:hypothetical protein
VSDDTPDNVWLTVCDGCRQWVPGIFTVTFDGKRLCEECAPQEERITIRPYPPAPQDSVCSCGAAAPALCEGCGAAFCPPCWNTHSHTTTFPAAAVRAASERPPLPPLTMDAVMKLVAFDEAWRFLWMGVAKWKPREDEPCPVCGVAGACRRGPDNLHWCVNVESALGARGHGGRLGYIHRVSRPRRKVVAA